MISFLQRIYIIVLFGVTFILFYCEYITIPFYTVRYENIFYL